MNDHLSGFASRAPKHSESPAIDIVVQCSNKANPGADTLFAPNRRS